MRDYKFSLSSGYSMIIRLGEEEVTVFTVKGRENSFSLEYSEVHNSLTWNRDYYKARRLLPHGMLRNIEKNCREVVRRER